MVEVPSYHNRVLVLVLVLVPKWLWFQHRLHQLLLAHTLHWPEVQSLPRWHLHRRHLTNIHKD
jgi:hypothetical protein